MTNGDYGAVEPQAHYHAAPVGARDSILRHGLRPGVSASRGEPGVYLYNDSMYPEDYRLDDPHDVWEVNTTGLDLHPDPEDHSVASYYRHPIPADRLTLTGTFVNGQPHQGSVTPRADYDHGGRQAKFRAMLTYVLDLGLSIYGMPNTFAEMVVVSVPFDSNKLNPLIYGTSDEGDLPFSVTVTPSGPRHTIIKLREETET